VELLVVIAIIATLAGIGVPVIIAQKKKGDLTEAIANSKSIGLAMFNFDQDYGGYPSEATGTQVDTNNPNSGMTFTGNSNAFFRQLVAAGYADSEKMFYAKAPYTIKPDNNMIGSACLAAREVGFAYVMKDASTALPDSGNSGMPLIVAALYNGVADGGQFDPDVYGRKAVIFRMDNSAVAESIRPSDKTVVVGGGKSLMTSGEGTVWGTTVPSPVLIPPMQ